MASPIKLLLLVASICMLACGPSHLTFEAKASDLHRPGNAFKQGKGPDDTVSITLPGKLLSAPESIQLVSRQQANWSSPQTAATAIVSANTAGDRNWMIDSFVPAERDRVNKELSDPAALARIRDYYRNIGTVKLLGWTELRGATILLLRADEPDGDATFLTLTLSKTPFGWRETDALETDDSFELIWAALHTGGVR